MKKITLIVIIGLISFPLFSQKETYNWTFGEKCGLSFNTPDLEPVNFETSLNTREGCSTMSTSSGELLFYTDGVYVFNKNNELMPNGFNLYGDYSATQSALIIKYPGHDNLYYIFTVGAVEGSSHHGFYYSVVDINAENNLGDVISKNIIINDFANEKLCAVRNANQGSYWLITYNTEQSSFYTYKFSKNGLDKNPTISPTFSDDNAFYIKSSKSGKLIANTRGTNKGITIYDFDNQTGILHLKYNFSIESYLVYGCEFSGDESKLYITNYSYNSTLHSFIGQFDLSSGNETAIQNSYTIIASHPQSSNFGALLLAPNNKIYASIETSNYLAVIDNPDLKGLQCGFKLNAHLLNGYSYLGLPNMILPVCPDYDMGLPSELIVCAGKEFQIGTNQKDGFKYSWQPADLVKQPEKSLTPVIIYSDTILTLVAKDTANGCSYSETIKLIIDTINYVIHGNNIFCEKDSCFLYVDSSLKNIQWSNGDFRNNIWVKDTGLVYYTAETIQGCIVSDTVKVTKYPKPESRILAEMVECQNNMILFKLSLIDSSLIIKEWSTGEISKSIFIQDTGYYWVEYTNEFGCTSRLDINIINNKFGTIILNENIFAQNCKGSWSKPVITLVNDYFGNLKVDSVYLSSKNQGMLKLSDIDKYLVRINHGDSMNISLTFLPSSTGDYNDTLHVVFRFPCFGEYLIPLKFKTNPATIEITSVDTLVKFGDRVCIPILGRYLCNSDKNLITSYKLTLKIDASVFIPDVVEKGLIDSLWTQDGFYCIEISDSNCNLTNTTQVINFLCGTFYKGDEPGSEIEIVGMNFDNGADTSSTNGSIRGEICQFRLRGIELFDLNALTVKPNPATDQIKLNVTNCDKGEIEFDFINSVGNTVESWTINRSGDDPDNFEINKNIKDYSSGAYIIRMRSTGGIISEMFLIAK